jgi:Spy/CpxP family protein refolding chaperone
MNTVGSERFEHGQLTAKDNNQQTVMNMKTKSLGHTISVMLAGGLLSTLALAAAETAPPPPGERPAQGERGRGERPAAQRPMAGGIGLDEQQRELLREAMQKNQDELRKLDEQMRTAQRELTKTVLAEKYDEKAVREKAEAVAKIQVQQTVLRAQAIAKVAPTLAPEQRERLENSPFALQMLMGGGGGMRPMGGPGGFGPGAPGERRGPPQ